MSRRNLDFHTVEEVVAALDRLQTGGYTKAGTWSLGQVCKHLTIFVRGSLDGFNVPRPAWPLRMIGPFLLRRMIKKRRMPTGVNVPAHFQPPKDPDEAQAVQELKDLLRRFERHQGPVHPSPLGNLDKANWLDLHLVHAAHHLSFLQPNR